MSGSDTLDFLKSCFVPPCPHGNDRPLLSLDFADYTATVNARCLIVRDVVREPPIVGLANDAIAAHLLVICGEHSVESLWTTDLSLETGKRVHSQLLSVSALTRPTVVKEALYLMRPRLLSSTFKCHPSSIACYVWILKQLKAPQVSEHLANLLPTALILTDDFESPNVKLGTDCLRHIVEHVTAEQLNRYGRTGVMLDALVKCFYRSEADVLTNVLDCYGALMKKTLHQSSFLQRSKFDDALKTILYNMYLEPKQTVRQVYAMRLGCLLKARGAGAVRHFTMLFKIIEEYALDPHTALNSLEALRQLLRVGWCRGRIVAEDVTTILLKVIAGYDIRGGKVDDDVFTSLRQTSSLLNEAFPEVVSELCAEGQCCEKNHPRNIFERIFVE